jgi:hypothetical protein
MNDEVIRRDAIASDADRAAQRFIESGADQPNRFLEGTQAHAIWAAHYTRMRAFYLDPESESAA